jgi:hypothetical protein
MLEESKVMAYFNEQSPIRAANRLAALELSLLRKVVKTLREEREGVLAED